MKFDENIGSVLALIVLIASVYAYVKSMIPWWGIPAGLFMVVVVIQTVESSFNPKPPKTASQKRDEIAYATILTSVTVSGVVDSVLPGGLGAI